jgi:hypothetical protein
MIVNVIKKTHSVINEKIAYLVGKILLYLAGLESKN